jgi:transposase
MCREVGEALAAPVEEVLKHIQAAAVVHPDESGWKQGGVKHWIWAVATKDAAYFRIERSRGSDVARELLGGEFKGRIVSDRWCAYTFIPVNRRQICWAHLKRDFQKIVDRGGVGQAFGEEALRLTKVLFTVWQAYERGDISRRGMRERLVEVETSFGALLGEGLVSTDKKLQGFCKKLLELGEALFLFTRVEGVEPTNNRAERALRPVVLWRKGSFGTWSAAGSRFVERMMTVVMTLRLRRASVLAYIGAVCLAADRGDPIPSMMKSRARDGPVNDKWAKSA